MKKWLLAVAALAAAALVVKKLVAHKDCDLETVEDIIFDDAIIPQNESSAGSSQPESPLEQTAELKSEAENIDEIG